MAESTQHKLDRVRPPRVQITYDVEIGGAVQRKELPLVIGVLADLSGKPDKPLPKLKERPFVDIDRDNFNEVMTAIGPRLAISMQNKLTDTAGFVSAELRFREIDDFSPEKLVYQVPALKRLLEIRGRLSDLLAKLDGNDDLDAKLQEIVASTENLKQIKSEGSVNA